MTRTSTVTTHLLEQVQIAAATLPQATGHSTQLSVLLEIPRQRSHGDLSTSVALQLASELKISPVELAQALCAQLKEQIEESHLKDSIELVEFKPPGFVNFTFSPKFLSKVLQEVLDRREDFGRGTIGKGKKVLIEFVSANPTGPLSVAHGRQAAVGDAIGSLLDFSGYKVSREYYLNDEGTQINLLGKSVLARAQEQVGQPSQFPEDGYKGAYVADIAGKLTQERGKGWTEAVDAETTAREKGVLVLTELIREQLKQFRVQFDSWFIQSSLRRWNYLNRSLDKLKKRGFLYEQDGAWWLKSTAFGDDKDRVVIRSDGRMTYIASDIAYHRRKLERRFDMLVNLWGPDHHGYIARLKGAVEGLGFSPEALVIRIVQLCTLKRAGKVIPMSTREGEFITLTQVMDEVGVDAARFFFLSRKTDAHLEFDLELAKQQTLENPVYYIQYAHARICSILRQEVPALPKPDFALLKESEELDLLRKCREFPGAVELSAKNFEPLGIITFLQELAETFHRFYDRHRVVSEDLALTASRLKLVEGVRIVAANGLTLLGVSAPDKM